MKHSAIATLILGAVLPLGGAPAPETFMRLVANAAKDDSGVWWQFVTNGPNGERQISPHFASEEKCEQVLKAVEAVLAKQYPDRYPLVGSCESYR